MDNLKIYLDKDINQDLIKSKKIAVIGFGSQGYGQSMNLKDSGCDVVLGLRLGGKSDTKAKKYGFKTMTIEEAVKWADIVQILIPDELQADVYEKQIKPNMHSGQYLMFSHGFNIHYKKIVVPSDINVIMVAPKGPGHTVRSQYVEGKGVPSLIAVYQDPSGDSKDVSLSYASAIGAGRAGIIETTFKEETETDLFGEQAVLCGGCEELIKAGFETLVNAGYQPEIAYFECLHEMKLIVDLMYEGGLERMNYSVSDTAEWGGYVSGPRVINDAAKEGMKEVLADIQSGKFAKEWIEENEDGCEDFLNRRTQQYHAEISETGRKLRSMMTFLNK